MKRHPSLAKAGHDKSLKCCDILIKYVELFNLKLAWLKLCVFVGSCYVLNSYNTTIITLLHSAALNNLTVLLRKWHNDVCWMSDFLLKTHWNVTYTTMSIYCPMQSYPHNPLLRKRHHDTSYLLTLLVSNLLLNVTNTTISICCPTQS